MTQSLLDNLWILICAALVLQMQAGFCLLETGLVRAKNSINVAMKNLADICLASILYFVVGFGLMYGTTWHGVIGTVIRGSDFLKSPWVASFFLFQVVFCGTATTIVSGAIAERVRFTGYLVISAVISTLIYPIFGHWVWGGAMLHGQPGWLAECGFIDFAGSAVVHGVGGWVALAAVSVVGPRLGRFDSARGVQPHNLPMATIGAMLLWFGWWGFNGGSTLALSEDVPLILLNTNLSAAAGGLTAVTVSFFIWKRPGVTETINGVIAGLVSVTAACHMVTPMSAVCTGAIGCLVHLVARELLVWRRLDDAVDAVAVHGFAGTWGVLAVAIFGDISQFPTPSRWIQFQVQLVGALVCFAWAFGVGLPVLKLVRWIVPLRATPTDERAGLNISEHHASTELIDLMSEMEAQQQTGDFSSRVTVEPHTEVGQLAQKYNRVLARVDTEIEERERANRALQVAERKYRLLFEHANVGIYQRSTGGKLLNVNPALCSIVGCDQKSLLDEEPTLIPSWYKHDDLRSEFREQLEESHAVENFEARITLASGKRIWVVETMQPVQDRDGRVLYYLGTIDDITEIKESAIQQVEAADAANRAKSMFLANMSHEIRTPLNGVIGMIELAQAGNLDAQQTKYLGIARTSADSLLRIINDILDFSKIEAGKLKLETVDFDLRSLIEDTAEALAWKAEEKSLEFLLCIDSAVPQCLSSDPSRIRQILFNFVGNAVKFTERGEVGIHVSVHSGDDRRFLHFDVIDTGIGIEPKAQSRLFHEFTQADESTTRKFGGTGLGLAISRRLAELLGGTVGLDSRLGSGSRFWFRVPIEDAVETEHTEFLDSDVSLGHALVASNSRRRAHFLTERLEEWGYEVTLSPTDALSDYSHENPFSVAIIDIPVEAASDDNPGLPSRNYQGHRSCSCVQQPICRVRTKSRPASWLVCSASRFALSNCVKHCKLSRRSSMPPDLLTRTGRCIQQRLPCRRRRQRRPPGRNSLPKRRHRIRYRAF